MLGMFLAWTGQTLNTSSKYLPCETMPGQTRLIFLPSFLLHLLFWLLTRLKAGIPALEGSLCVYFGVKLWEAYDIAELSRASDTSDTAVGIILTKQLINAHLEYLTFLPTARTYVCIHTSYDRCTRCQPYVTVAVIVYTRFVRCMTDQTFIITYWLAARHHNIRGFTC